MYLHNEVSDKEVQTDSTSANEDKEEINICTNENCVSFIVCI